MKKYIPDYLYLFLMLCTLVHTAKAAPFTQSDKELNCDIHKTSIQLDDPEFPVTPEMVFEEFGVSTPEHHFVPVQITNVVWFRHTPNTDVFYTTFGIVNPSKPKGNKGEDRDQVVWNANDELVSITGYQEHYSPVQKKRVWTEFSFSYLNGTRWNVNGVLVTLTQKSLHARIRADQIKCKID